MTRRRLVVISDYAWRTGGIEEFVCELVAHSSSTYECRVVSWTDQVKLPDDFAGLHVVECGDVRGLWAELDSADLVLIVTSFNVRLLARAAGEYLLQRRVPAIVVVHTSGHSNLASSSSVQEEWLLGLAEGCDSVVAVSRDVKSALARIRDFPIERTTVIENAARLQHTAPRRRGRTNVSFIGRPHPQKGYHLFERLARELADSGLRFAANTVSVRPDADIPGVEHSYQLSDPDLVRFFDAADLIVAPYLKADGLPLAILEALNCGVPVMGFDVPGLGALLREHGQTVLEPDYRALRSALEVWRSGRLDIREPRPGDVQSWPDQLAQYVTLFGETTACTGTNVARQTPSASRANSA